MEHRWWGELTRGRVILMSTSTPEAHPSLMLLVFISSLSWWLCGGVNLPTLAPGLNRVNVHINSLYVLKSPALVGLWLTESDHVTWILASDWLRVITWTGYWPLIGWEWSRDLDTGLWLAESDHVTWILTSDWRCYEATEWLRDMKQRSSGTQDQEPFNDLNLKTGT